MIILLQWTSTAIPSPQYQAVGGMDDAISFREMKAGEEKAVSQLVTRIFNEFIAPGYSAEGVREFLRYIKPEILRQLAQEGHLFLVAAVKDKIVGVILIRIRNHRNHITLLFVDAKYHRRGIARTLLNRALEIRRGRDPTIEEITVKSSPYAVLIYEKLGFQQLQPEQVENGIRFVPMVLEL